MAVAVGKKYSLGEFELETAKRLLTREGHQVRLAHRPFHVLLHLIENRDRLVTRQELLDRFWEGRDVYDLTLSRCVSSIRKALDDQSDRPRFIETRWSEGYRFIGPVEEQSALVDSDWEIERVRGVKITVEDDSRPPSLTDPAEPQLLLGNAVPAAGALAALQSTAIESTQIGPSKVGSKATTLTVIALVIVLAVGGIWLYRYRANAAAPESIHSIAVMPLKNLTGDSANDYFSDGMTESLITSLSKIDGLTVISRSSVFRFKNKDLTPQEIGNQFGVASVFEGSVRTVGDSVRVAVRLVSVKDGRVLWVSDEKDRAFGDVFAVQDDIARNVASGLRLQLSGKSAEQLTHRYTANAAAYQLYLQGRFYLNNYASNDDLLKAARYFDSAIAKDPVYALAYAGLADAYSSMAIDWQDPRSVFPKAKEYAERALELDDTLGEAHFSRGAIAYFYEWDWPRAQSELDRALDLDAKSIESNACYLHSRESLGKTDEALAQVRRALDKNPLSTYISEELGCASYYAHRYEQAMSFSRDTLRTDPSYALAHYNLARALGQQRMYGQAIAELNTAISTWGRSTMLVSELAYDYAASGRKAEARKLLDELQRRSANEFIDPYPIAWIYVALGDNDKALQSLERAYEVRSAWMPWIKLEPKFDALRTEPRFRSMLGRLNLEN